jgi:hypothetical protein
MKSKEGGPPDRKVEMYVCVRGKQDLLVTTISLWLLSWRSAVKAAMR